MSLIVKWQLLPGLMRLLARALTQIYPYGGDIQGLTSLQIEFGSII